ncbi:flippase [Polynucleobacter sp. MG-5-Ahmo-C2]|uniref:flippase n=1 Tax=Polynucleobacter sp. MG-5-Ahmo-C2 TaxID=2081051 RepID=UPI001BFD9514|nr:flippase [Polynucleobacter sp. MG-5-Ahmo-C2]QWD98811.1 flippase [Polynucleobacter sp. MG-5-Ahmo-C2]
MKNNSPQWLLYLPNFLRDRLLGRDNFLSIIHNSGWLLLDKIMRAIFGLLVGAWVARYLGPSQFGELAYCIAFVAIFQSISLLGLDGIAVREIVSDERHSGVVLGTIFRMRFAAGLICWLTVTILYGFSNNYQSESFLLAALVAGGLIFQSADSIDLWFQSQLQSRRTVLAKLFAYLLSNGVKVALILLEAPLLAFAGVIMFEAMLNSLVLYVSYRRFPAPNTWAYNLLVSRNLLSESWPYILSTVSIVIYMRIDQIMIKSLLDEKSLGIYAAMIPISSLWNIVPMVICMSVAPYIAKIKNSDNIKFEMIMLKIFRIALILSVMAIFVTWILSGPVVSLMYGSAYHGAADILNIYVLTNIPIFLGVVQGLWFVNNKKPHLALLQTISGALFSIFGNLLLIPVFGLKGAALTAVIAQLISAVLINFIFSRKLFYMQIGYGFRSRGLDDL